MKYTYPVLTPYFSTALWQRADHTHETHKNPKTSHLSISLENIRGAVSLRWFLALALKQSLE